MASKTTEEKFLAAITKTIKVIAHTSIVTVYFSYFTMYSQYTNRTILSCWATMYERKYGKALELLNASIKDKTFARNMSNALGYQVTMEETDWKEGRIIPLKPDKYELPNTTAGKNDHRHLILSRFIAFYLTSSTLLYSTLLYSTLLYSTLLYSTLFILLRILLSRINIRCIIILFFVLSFPQPLSS
jgi:hypothetical protein